MEETQQVNIGTGQDLSGIANQTSNVNFDVPTKTDDDNFNDNINYNNYSDKTTPQQMNYDDSEMRKNINGLSKYCKAMQTTVLASEVSLVNMSLMLTLQTQNVEAIGKFA